MTGQIQYKKLTLNEWLLKVSEVLFVCNVLTVWLRGEKGYLETAEDGGVVVSCSESRHISCSCNAGRWLYRLSQGFVLSANPIPVLSSGKKEVIKFQLAWVKQIIKEMETEKGCYCQVLKELKQQHLKNSRKFGSIRKRVLYYKTIVLHL